MTKRFVIVKPNIEEFNVSPYNGEIQKLITNEICNITGMTIDELGYEGTTAMIHRKSKKRLILSRFRLSDVTEAKRSKFGGNPKIEVIEDFKKLNGYFYYGDINDYIYKLDEKEDVLIVRWHTTLTMAYITDSYLLDPNFDVNHRIIQKEVNKKDDHVPIIFVIRRSYGINSDKHYLRLS